MHEIPLDSIVLLEDISLEIASQYRSRELIEQNIKNLLMVSSDDLPPITIAQIEQGYALIDGAHRVECARRRGDKMIKAEFVEVRSHQELIKRAYLANLAHGLPDRTSRRVDFALWLVQTEKLSLREAAAVAKCDQSSITRRKQKLKAQEEPMDAVEPENLKPLKRLFKAIDGLKDYDDSNMFEDIRRCLGGKVEAVDDLYEAICDITEAYWKLVGDS